MRIRPVFICASTYKSPQREWLRLLESGFACKCSRWFRISISICLDTANRLYHWFLRLPRMEWVAFQSFQLHLIDPGLSGKPPPTHLLWLPC